MLRSAGRRLLETGLDAALYSFWVAVWGVLLTAIGLAFSIFQGADAKWQYAFGGALAAFALVLVLTSSVVWVARWRKPKVKRVGRKGLLDYAVEKDQSLKAATESMGKIGSETQKMGRTIKRGTSKINALQRRGGPRMQERVRSQSKRIARKIEKRARLIDLHAKRLADNVTLFSDSLTGWLRGLATQKTPPTDKKTLMEGLKNTRDIIATGALPSIVSFRASVNGIRNMSADLDLAGETLVGVLDSIIDSMNRYVKLSDDALAQLRQRH